MWIKKMARWQQKLFSSWTWNAITSVLESFFGVGLLCLVYIEIAWWESYFVSRLKIVIFIRMNNKFNKLSNKFKKWATGPKTDHKFPKLSNNFQSWSTISKAEQQNLKLSKKKSKTEQQNLKWLGGGWVDGWGVVGWVDG